MRLQEVDTVQDLKEWVEENMKGARLTVDSAGDVVIHTGLISTMGGYLHEKDSCDDCGQVEWLCICKPDEGGEDGE